MAGRLFFFAVAKGGGVKVHLLELPPHFRGTPTLKKNV